MECPKCGLINPPNSLKCDCGYSFKDKTVTQIENENIKIKRNKFTAQLNGSIVFLIIGIISSVILLIKIMNSKYDRNLLQQIIEFYSDKNVYVKVKGIPALVLVGLFGVLYNNIKLNQYKNKKSKTSGKKKETEI
ncbi:hypothetical protein K7J14_14760 [Treponema zuelzerae]|uniref:Uncharacterized protein n=1 Tax=Teretinema zuelzerae TaxID=156 RepID=A0AAE3EM20_9SPIR|nr:hypothetical protein [Teretinema zuelzerae]MCD1655958.1 hypothetical protein [Teretinema zuelzerae]